MYSGVLETGARVRLIVLAVRLGALGDIKLLWRK